MSGKKFPKLHLVTPTLDGKVTAEYVQALSALQKALYQNSINLSMKFQIGNSLLAAGRNWLANDFLESDADWLLMVDSDIAYRPQDVVAALPHLEGAIIGFPCSKKFAKWERVAQTVRENPDFPHTGIPAILGDANFHLGVSDYLFPNEYGLAKVKWIGTGVMLVSRSSLEKIIKENPEDKIEIDGKIMQEFFRYDTFLEQKNGVEYKSITGEDVAFCRLAKESGLEVYAKIDALTTHMGFSLYQFDAKVVAQLKNVPNQMESQKK
jgi:hypothetical protein